MSYKEMTGIFCEMRPLSESKDAKLVERLCAAVVQQAVSLVQGDPSSTLTVKEVAKDQTCGAKVPK